MEVWATVVFGVAWSVIGVWVGYCIRKEQEQRRRRLDRFKPPNLDMAEMAVIPREWNCEVLYITDGDHAGQYYATVFCTRFYNAIGNTRAEALARAIAKATDAAEEKL